MNTPQQFAESPALALALALAKAFAKAVTEVRDETSLLVDNVLGDSALFAELSKALSTTLYEFLRSKESGG